MKQDEIVVGKTYLTKIGERVVRVVVTRLVETSTTLHNIGFGQKGTRRGVRFEVRRESEDKPLPKLRHASALRPFHKGAKNMAHDTVNTAVDGEMNIEVQTLTDAQVLTTRMREPR